MNNLRGASQVEVNGVYRPVKFGTNQTAIFCQVQGITIKQAGELLSPKKLKANDVAPQLLIDFCYSALVAGAKSAKKEVDFDAFDVGDWMDEDPALVGKIMDVAAGANGPNAESLPTLEKI